MRSFRYWAIAALALSACGGNDNSGNTHTVGGALTGLGGTVVLTNNGGDDLTLTQDGNFTFATGVAAGGAYLVAVKTQPASQTCSVADGSGTMGSANVTNVTVTCTANATLTYTVGGNVSGLSGTVVLTNNGGDDLSRDADGGFTFATSLADGAAYDVAVKTQPSGQTCTVSSGSGTVSGANVTSVTVTCTASGTTTHTIGGTVTGLWGTVVLTNNGGDDVTVIRDADHSDSWNTPPTFTFGTALAENASYDVAVKTQPSSPYHTTCTVSSGTGTVGSADVANVQVVCTGFGAACTGDGDCSGEFNLCGHVNNIPDGCTKSCGNDDANCLVGSNGTQNCNNSNFCRW